MRVQPKKRLGQHFLKDRQIAGRIAALVDPDRFDYVLEVGPGMGVLTQPLLERFGERLYVVELDRESVDYLEVHFSDLKDRIFSCDFLRMDLREHFQGRLAIVGNFPYNISSQILFRILDYPELVTGLYGMFQREVARRVTADPGSREYGILSVLLAYYYHRSYEFTVHEQVFDPPPRVKSGVIRLEACAASENPINMESLRLIVKTAFNQRRKMLRNSLSSLYPKHLAQEQIFSMRPEQLGLSDFLYLLELFD